MKPIPIGIIGIGNMGRNHARIMALLSEYDFKGIYDANYNVAKSYSDIYKTKAYTSIDELFGDIEAVVIASPSSSHFAVAAKACEYKLHAFVEKPLTIEAEDSEKLSDMFEQNNKILFVGHIERYNPVLGVLSDVLIGEEIIAVDVHRMSPYDPRIFDSDVITDLMVHDIDIVINVINQTEIKSIKAIGANVKSYKKADYVQALFSFENGMMASISSSRITEEKIRIFEVHTKSAYIQADFLARRLTITRRTNYYFDPGYIMGYKQENIVEKVMVPYLEPLQVEHQAFAKCINEKINPLTDGAAAIRTLKIAEFIRKEVNI